MKADIRDQKALRNKYHVFHDRFDAGSVLAEMLEPAYGKARDTLVLAIPAGGVPVGIEVSRKLSLPFDLVIARKMQIPGNTEAGFGAVTLEGSIFFNEDLLSRLHLTPGQIEHQTDLARREIEERNRLFRNGKPFPQLTGKTVILVDDGIASGYTMKASVHSARRMGAARIAVAVPTAPMQSLRRMEDLVEEIHCANIRETTFFAVADAYLDWYDLSREDVLELLGRE